MSLNTIITMSDTLNRNVVSSCAHLKKTEAADELVPKYIPVLDQVLESVSLTSSCKVKVWFKIMGLVENCLPDFQKSFVDVDEFPIYQELEVGDLWTVKLPLQ